MKYLLQTILLGFALSVFAHGGTVSIADFGAIPDDNIDDSNSIQEAVYKLQTQGGGTLVFPEGVWDVRREIDFSTSNNYISYKLLGDKGSEIVVSAGPEATVFYFGNQNQVIVENLIITGKKAPASDMIDCKYLFYFDNVSQRFLRGMEIYGVFATGALVYTGTGTTVIENSIFGGNGTHNASVVAFNSSLSVINTNFIDYANYKDEHFSKTYVNGGAWIKTDSNSVVEDAYGQRVVRITDSRFDEGARIAIQIANAAHVAISGINVNVSGMDDARGIELSNVENAEINFSWFGLTTVARPAIVALNRTTLEITALKFGAAVYFADIDSTSAVSAKFCPQCESSLRRTKK